MLWDKLLVLSELTTKLFEHLVLVNADTPMLIRDSLCHPFLHSRQRVPPSAVTVNQGCMAVEGALSVCCTRASRSDRSFPTDVHLFQIGLSLSETDVWNIDHMLARCWRSLNRLPVKLSEKGMLIQCYFAARRSDWECNILEITQQSIVITLLCGSQISQHTSHM